VLSLSGGVRRVPCASKMSQVTVYTSGSCGYCVRAERLLAERGIEFESIDLDGDPALREKLLELTGAWTVPQIVIDGTPIGGYTELSELAANGSLEALLAV